MAAATSWIMVVNSEKYSGMTHFAFSAPSTRPSEASLMFGLGLKMLRFHSQLEPERVHYRLMNGTLHTI